MIDNKPPFYQMLNHHDTADEIMRIGETEPHMSIDQPIDWRSFIDSPYTQMLKDTNKMEFKSYDIPKFDPSYFPDVELIIKDPNINYDIIRGIYYYFSKEVREKFSEEYLNVQYLPVDDSKSIPEIREKEYMMVHFLSMRAAVDPESSVYELRRKINDGTARGPDYKRTYEVNWADGFTADTPLFRVCGLPLSLYATRIFIKQVFDYGFTGMAFMKTGRPNLKTGPAEIDLNDPTFDINDYYITPDKLE